MTQQEQNETDNISLADIMSNPLIPEKEEELQSTQDNSTDQEDPPSRSKIQDDEFDRLGILTQYIGLQTATTPAKGSNSSQQSVTRLTDNF